MTGRLSLELSGTKCSRGANGTTRIFLSAGGSHVARSRLVAEDGTMMASASRAARRTPIRKSVRRTHGWNCGKCRHVRSCTVTTRRPFRWGRATALTEWNTSTRPRNDSTVGPPHARGIIGTKNVNRKFEFEVTSTSRMAGDDTLGGGTLAHGLKALKNSSE